MAVNMLRRLKLIDWRELRIPSSRFGAEQLIDNCHLYPPVARTESVRSSDHRQPAATRTKRKGGVDPRDLGVRQPYIGPPALSSTCSTLDALRIAKTDGRRVRNESAIWRVVASCAFAMSASKRPRDV